MSHKFLHPLLYVLLASVVLGACGPAALTAPSAAPTDPVVSAVTLAPSATLMPTLPPPPTPAAPPTVTALPPELSAIALDCTDSVNLNVGEFQAQNNTWGKGELTGWTQCIGLSSLPDGRLAARWTWDWPEAGTNVKAYPEIVYGQKPGGPSTTPALPLLVKAVGAAKIDYEVSSTHSGDLNLAFDIWLTSTANPDTWGVPPITHEIMIWIDRAGMAPGGAWKGTIEINGATYLVYVGDKWGDGWRYVAFVSKEPQIGAGSIDLAPFLAYMQENKLATGDEYLASIEFGNEIASGAGETVLSRYEVKIEKNP